MRPPLVMRRVILPQAIRVVPAALRQHDDHDAEGLVDRLRDHRRGAHPRGQLIAASTFKNMTVFTLVALLYLAMSLPLTFFARWLEKKFGRK